MIIGINYQYGVKKRTPYIIQILTSKSDNIKKTLDSKGIEHLLETYKKNVNKKNELKNFNYKIVSFGEFKINELTENIIVNNISYESEINYILYKGGIIINVRNLSIKDAVGFCLQFPSEDIRKKVNNSLLADKYKDIEMLAMGKGWIPENKIPVHKKALNQYEFDDIIDESNDLTSLINQIKNLIINHNL